jgi:hypothetical protein
MRPFSEHNQGTGTHQRQIHTGRDLHTIRMLVGGRSLVRKMPTNLCDEQLIPTDLASSFHTAPTNL